MFFALLRTRFKTLLFTVLFAFAAPRVARVLRGFGERKRRSGGGTLTTTVPIGAADALEKVAGWARPERKRRSR